jgi:uncharacterized protein
LAFSRLRAHITMVFFKTQFIAKFASHFAPHLVCSAMVFFSTTATAQAESTAQQLPLVTLNAGMHLIQAQVAQTPDQRSAGLMFRKNMGANEGMLFVFEEAGQQCFWMKNTFLPLDAAFLADDGNIVNIAHMKPHSQDNHCSSQPVRLVLEMNDGWFAKKGLKVGSKLQGTAFKN